MTETFDEIQDISKRADMDYNKVLDIILYLKRESIRLDSCAENLLSLLMRKE